MDLVDKFVAKYGRLPTEIDSDYLEMLNMSKYRILAVPMFKPGKCGNCGASKNDGRQYIDFGLEVDWYGTVYLCTDCLKDIAVNAGLFKEQEEKMLALMVENERLIALKEQGENLHETVTKTFEEFKEYYASLHSLGDNSPPDSPTSVGTEETVNSEPEPNNSKSRASKSSNGSGRSNVPSLADLINKSDN